jgi:hypothetical protein
MESSLRPSGLLVPRTPLLSVKDVEPLTGPCHDSATASLRALMRRNDVGHHDHDRAPHPDRVLHRGSVLLPLAAADEPHASM